MNVTHFDLATDNLHDLYLQYRKYPGPIKVSNAFAGARISQLRDVHKFSADVGEMLIPVSSEYVRALNNSLFGRENPNSAEVFAAGDSFSPPVFNRGQTSVSEYLRYIETDTSTPLLCPEMLMPMELDHLVKLYQLQDTGTHYKADQWYNFFLGNRGNYAHTHYDWNGAINLFYQVFGSKRITLIPPTSSHKLVPFSNFSGVFFENMDPSEREAYFKYTGAVSFDLEAGDALLIPPLYWHFIEYTDTGASLNLRYYSHKLTSWACTHLHKSPTLQIYLHDLIQNDQLSDTESNLWVKIGEALSSPSSDLVDKINSLINAMYVCRFSKDARAIQSYPFEHTFSRLLGPSHLNETSSVQFQNKCRTGYRISNERPTMNLIYEDPSHLRQILDNYNE